MFFICYKICQEKGLGGPDQCDSVTWVCPARGKVGSVIPDPSGHVPGLPVWSPVGVRTRGSQALFLSHADVSLPLFLPSSSLSKNK